LATLPAPAATGALDRIRVGGAIRVAYPANAYPLAFKDADGAPRGYSVDLCRRLIADIRQGLGLEAVEIAWIEGNTPRRLAAVANGEAELDCGTTTVTLARQERVDFSNPVFVESGGLMVRADSAIADLADLAEQRIGVVPETTTERRLRAALSAAAIEAEPVPIRDAEDGRRQLDRGAVAAVAGDRLVLLGQAADSTAPEAYRLIEAALSVEPLAFALPRNDADFRLAVNRGLARLYRGGDVDRIFRRWFGAQARPTRLLETIYFIYGFAD
jgi:ABC-type amino acid transport substrate-binding protein